MSLIENSLLGKINKIDIAIQRIQFAFRMANNRGIEVLFVAFSGGKDSIVIEKLCELAEIKYTLNYNMTGIDPPQLINFMRNEYDDKLIWHPYEKSMWQLIVKNGMPPTSAARFCCRYLKERGGENQFCVTGVRWAESAGRKNNRRPFENNGKTIKESILFNDNEDNRKDFERCVMKSKFVINPIIDWSDSDVWEFIKLYKLPYCNLYDKGYKRLGCIGCPLKQIKERKQDFEKFPKFRNLYIKAFDRMLKEHQYKKQPTWKTGEDVMSWWLSGLDKNVESFLL